MKINASLLCLLTIDTGKSNEVFFAYWKELEEIAPEEIFWYPGRGKDGFAATLWPDKNIRQWLVVGNDGELRDLWETLLQTRSLSVRTAQAAEPVVFTFSTTSIEREPVQDNIIAIPGIDRCNPDPVRYLRERHLPEIAFLIDEKNNCRFLEGFQYHLAVKPMVPAGLLSEGSLYQYLLDKIVAVYQPRGVSYHLYEQIVEGGSRRLRGFIQSDEAFRRHHQVVIRSDDGESRLGQGNIDPVTGLWAVDNVGADGQGQFLLEHKATGNYTFGERYAILRNIQVNAEIVHTVIVDLFNRKVPVSDKKHDWLPAVSSGIRWDGTIYPDTRQAEIELSDRLTDILLSLGEHVIINDPFFLGDVKEVDSKIQFCSRSQLIFFNALVIALCKGHLRTLTMIGYWKKAKNFAEGGKETFIEHYREVANFLQKLLRNVPDKQLKSFDLVFAKQTFHDRYWLPNNPSATVCFHVSNSVNGPFEQNELNVKLENDMNTFKEVAKIMTRLDEGEKINLLA